MNSGNGTMVKRVRKGNARVFCEISFALKEVSYLPL
jgi:hypothetical protein